MFDGLIDRFQILQRKILGYGYITGSEVDGIMRDLRITLLEADVNYLVVKDFVESVRSKVAGLNLTGRMNPGDLILKAVYEEMVGLLGGAAHHLEFKGDATVITLIGLQGAGKTTTAVKLSRRYREKDPLLVGVDTKRPAAVAQLAALAQRSEAAFFAAKANNPVAIAQEAIAWARAKEHRIVIIDTAGRLHVDDELLNELNAIHRAVSPAYRLLVADGMTGQDAVNQTRTFGAKVGIDGVILTKLDGDTRGGAALSIVRAGRVPIFFVGTGEAVDGLEEFHPERMAQRILGRGDLATLVEKVKAIETESETGAREGLKKRLARGELNLEDFMNQLRSLKKLGPLAKLAALIPGARESDVDEAEIKKIEAIINSMTGKERRYPEILDGSRKRRIAAGSGTAVADINRLLKQFDGAREMLRQMSGGKIDLKNARRR